MVNARLYKRIDHGNLLFAWLMGVDDLFMIILSSLCVLKRQKASLDPEDSMCSWSNMICERYNSFYPSTAFHVAAIKGAAHVLTKFK